MLRSPTTGLTRSFKLNDRGEPKSGSISGRLWRYKGWWGSRTKKLEAQTLGVRILDLQLWKKPYCPLIHPYNPDN